MKSLLVSLFAASTLVLTSEAAFAQNNAPIRMGQTTAQQAFEQADTAIARQTARIGELEAQIQALTGRVETLEFQLGRATEAREDAERDTQKLLERLSRLEGKVEALSSRPVVVTSDRSESFTSTESGRTVTSSTGSEPRVLSGGSWTRASEPTVQSPQDTSPVVTTTTVTRTQPPQTGSLGTLPASKLPGEAGALFQLGRDRLMVFDYDGAEVAFRAFLEQFKDDPQVGEANYWMGEVLYQKNDFAGSAGFFTDLLKNYPEESHRGEALVKLARSLRKVGETTRACQFLANLDKVDPNASTITRQRVLQEKQLSNCK